MCVQNSICNLIFSQSRITKTNARGMKIYIKKKKNRNDLRFVSLHTVARIRKNHAKSRRGPKRCIEKCRTDRRTSHLVFSCEFSFLVWKYVRLDKYLQLFVQARDVCTFNQCHTHETSKKHTLWLETMGVTENIMLNACLATANINGNV